ncbi:hypothetical protein [Jiulongibacter sp. NS-SX5]
MKSPVLRGISKVGEIGSSEPVFVLVFSTLQLQKMWIQNAVNFGIAV